MPLYRYSRWDGTQKIDLDADQLLSAMADDLLSDGDPWRALRRLMQQGARTPEGQRMPGLKDLLDKLRRQKQQRLDRYDLGSSLEDIKKKLEEVVQTERQGIKDKVPEGAPRAQREQKLDAIPPDPAGRLRDLQQYDFVSPEAKQKFDELLASLRQQMMQPMFNSLQQAMQNMSPQDLALKIELAKLDLARGNFAEALSTLEGIKPDRFPASAVPLKAASLLGLGRRSDAESLITGVKASPGAALDLAHVFVEAKAADAALKTLTLISPVPKKAAAQFYYLKGRALRQKGDNAAAVTSFRQALAADPKSTETLVAMAEIFAGEKKHAESLQMLEKARDLSPESKEVLRHLLVEAMQSGQNDKGSQAAQELQHKSNELDDRFLVASVMLQQKQFLSASHILEDYVTQRPQDAKAYLGLGMAYTSLLRYADARQALERSLQLKPDVAETEYQLGLLAGQQGNREEAIQHWQKAVELQPHHAQALFSLGTMYLESGKLTEAEGTFRQSLATNSSNMKAEYNLALVLNKLGKSEEAKQHFERYRKMQEAEHTTSGNPPRAPDHP